MEVQQARLENPAMTFDEVSMEQSKSFVMALQELRNLRPQLYSAAEYCEKSYLHSEQKQMVLDNLKDYAIRALVNAVDHLGTVAYKLTDLLEQQALDLSTTELKFLCINQKLLTCQTYMNKEGLRQQQLMAFIPRHHKRYILPNSVNKKVHFSPHIQMDARQSHLQARPRVNPSGTSTSKTLSWHLASETTSTLKGTQHALMSTEGPKTSGVFHLLDSEESTQTKSLSTPLHLQSGVPATSAVTQTFGVTRREYLEGSKPLTAFRSFETINRREIIRAPVRSKSMLSAFFAKHKILKQKPSPVS